MQSDHLFIPQMKGKSLLDTKNKMRNIAFAPPFWQNCFPFRLHMFISNCRCFAAQMLPMQFKNSFCHSNVFCLQTVTMNLERYFCKLYIFPISPPSQALISSLSLLSSSLHVFPALCYSLQNSSHTLTPGHAATESRIIINQS